MLLSREEFAEFAKLPIDDPATHTLALAAGGSEADDAEDYGSCARAASMTSTGTAGRSCRWMRRETSFLIASRTFLSSQGESVSWE
jgi:hypothetical protein